MESEIWKDVVGYEGLYQVSNLGRVKSIGRFVRTGKDNKRFHNGKIMKQRRNKLGYMFVGLMDGIGGRKNARVHRLVALAFIPNHQNLPQINHKDVNPSNNHVSNLEWCDQSYNNSYDNANIKRSLTRKENYKGRPLLMMDMDGNVLKRFDGIRDAEKYIKKPHTGHISDCCNNKRHSAYGYFWKWEDNNLIKL